MSQQLDRQPSLRTPLGLHNENVPPVSRFGYKGPSPARLRPEQPQQAEEAHTSSPLKAWEIRPEDAIAETHSCRPRHVEDAGKPELPDLLALFRDAMPDPDDLVPLLRLNPTAGRYDFKDRIAELTGMIKPLKAAITEQRRGCLDLETALGKAQEDISSRYSALTKERLGLRAASESLESGLAAFRQKAEERGLRIKQLETAAEASKRERAEELGRLERKLEAQKLEQAKERAQQAERLKEAEESAVRRQAAERGELEAQLAELRVRLEEERARHARELQAAGAAAEAAAREVREEHVRALAGLERSHAEATAAAEADHAEALSQQAAEAERRLAAAHATAAKERAAVFEATEQQRAEAQAAMEAARAKSADMAHRLEEVRSQAAREQADALAAAERSHKEAADAARAQALKAHAEEAARALEAAKARAEQEKADALAAADRLRAEAVAAEAAKAEAAKAEALATFMAEEMRRRTHAAQGQVEALAAQERSHEEALSAVKASKAEALASQAAEHAKRMEEVHRQAAQEREEVLVSARRRHAQALSAIEAERREALAAQVAEAELRAEEARAQAVKQQADALAAAERRHAEVLAQAALERAQALQSQGAEMERKAEEARERAAAEKAEALAAAKQRHGEALAAQAAEAERRLEGARAEAARQQADALAAVEQAHIEALAVQAAEASRRMEGACTGTVQAQVEAMAATERSRAEALATQVQHLERQCRRLEADRRTLHNTIQELRGNVRVFARVRPSADAAATPAVSCLPDEASLNLTLPCRSGTSTDEVVQKEHGFSFNRVFGPSTRQTDIFDEVSPLVQSALDGYKVCLFSYGQTGSGKTHTMLGESTDDGRGIIPRSVEQVVQASKSHRTRGWEYAMEASCIEIYNDSVRDLLALSGSQQTERQVIAPAGAEGCPRISGAETERVTSVEVARELVQRIAAMRVTKKTHMNDESSRSHVLFMLYVTGTHKDNQQRLEGFLCFADLAGSERVKRSGVVGAELKEACKINQSLTALGDVFGAIGKGWDFVPFRNSKLTQLLQPCLSGDGKALMFVHLSPASDDADESNLSLQFASRVNACCLSQRGGGPKRHISSTAQPAAAGGAGGSSGGGHGSGAQGRQGALSRSRRQTPR